MLAKRHAALGFIFVTVLLDMLAFGVVAPVMPKLISDFLGCNTARASEYLGLFITTWALMQFFFAPVLGLLSDRFGRRPVILISNFGLSLDYLIMALAPSIRWLFLGRVLAGIPSASRRKWDNHSRRLASIDRARNLLGYNPGQISHLTKPG